MASFKTEVCIPVVPLNDCDILCIDQQGGKWDRYTRQLIREAAMGRQHTRIITYAQVSGQSHIHTNTVLQREEKKGFKEHIQTLTSIPIDKGAESSNSG